MKKINSLNPSFWKQFSISIILWLIPLILISSYFFYSIYSARINVLTEKQDVSIAVAAHDIKRIISDHMSVINIFYEDIDDRVQTNSFDLEHIASKWLSFIKNKKHYDQIRILDTTGMEVLRVNYNSGNPAITPKDQLQNKSSRYYFTEAINLKAGEIYVSSLDLNKERGKIQQPLKPMIRYVVPFNNKSGEKGGVIIFNYLAEELIAEIKKKNNQYLSTIMLLNSDGYYLINKDDSKEWGFMYDKNTLFQLEQPDVWKVLIKKEKGFIKAGNNHFSFTTIYPYKSFNQSYKWFLISHLSSDSIKSIIYNKIKSLLPFIGIVFIILLFISGELARLRVKQYLFVNNLEIMVANRTEELASEIKVRKEVEKKLLKMASYDELTGLANRMLFIDRLNLSMSLARRTNTQLALLFIDLDRFKEVNDTYGHSTGDLLLKQVSNRLISSIRESDLVGRIGGDEFLVLLQSSTSEKYIAQVAQHIVKKLSDVFMINGEQIFIGSSIGIAVFNGEDVSSELLVERADKAMYEVKESGKNGFKFQTN